MVGSRFVVAPATLRSVAPKTEATEAGRAAPGAVVPFPFAVGDRSLNVCAIATSPARSRKPRIVMPVIRRFISIDNLSAFALISGTPSQGEQHLYLFAQPVTKLPTRLHSPAAGDNARSLSAEGYD